MQDNLQETIKQLKALGADIMASQYSPMEQSHNTESLDNEDGLCPEAVAKDYIDNVKAFVKSMDFMRLGQAINHNQWQAAAMKASKMSAEAKRLGITGFERPLTGIRQNINRRNSKEALRVMSVLITIRVRILKLLGIK